MQLKSKSWFNYTKINYKINCSMQNNYSDKYKREA